MPQVGIDRLIGLNLTAAKKLDAYNFADAPHKIVFNIPINGIAGRVYSWLERPDGIWLQFQRSNGGFYYIKADLGSFKATDQILQQYKLQKISEEKELIKQKGTFPYYIEKYGVWVLGAVIGMVIIKEYFKSKK